MTLTLAIMCPSTGGHEKAVASWKRTMTQKWPITIDKTIKGDDAGYLVKVETFRKQARADVIAYFHSDLTILEHGWDTLVLREFRDPSVAVVSFFGARELGHRDLYKVPYDFRQLARGDCWSNLTDAEAHGQRTSGVMDVAMIDSFSCIVRREWLAALGGWPVATFPPSHMSDFWLCCQAHRASKRVRLVGIECEHKSGGVRGDGAFDYPKWASETRWGSDEGMHAEAHRLCYEEFRDVLPVRR